jgi:crotonobetainyl-CoA:carnitine CoA-transferase CaiB-like acyl-CoA transferase
MCQAIGVDELIDDERFVDSRSRYRNMPLLIDLIDEALAARSRDEWGELFDKAGLIWGPVLGLHEVPQDPQAIELGMFPNIEHPQMGDYRTVNIPMRFANADVKPQGPSPIVGEHTTQILTNNGYTDAEITALEQSGVIGILEN